MQRHNYSTEYYYKNTQKTHIFPLIKHKSQIKKNRFVCVKNGMLGMLYILNQISSKNNHVH